MPQLEVGCIEQLRWVLSAITKGWADSDSFMQMRSSRRASWYTNSKILQPVMAGAKQEMSWQSPNFG